MFTLTLENVKEAARKAYDEKRLTAQNPDRPRNEEACVYDGGKLSDGRQCGCAIGVALPPEVLESIVASNLNALPISNSMFKKLISFDDNFMISRLQDAHDSWASITHKQLPDDAAAAERKFLEVLYA